MRCQLTIKDTLDEDGDQRHPRESDGHGGLCLRERSAMASSGLKGCHGALGSKMELIGFCGRGWRTICVNGESPSELPDR